MIEDLVDAARKIETESIKKHGVCEKVPIEECWRNIGKDLAGVNRVDTNKGDKENPEYRCRLLAKELKKDKREDLFAATSPLEAKKMLFSVWGSITTGDVLGVWRRSACAFPRKSKEKSVCGFVGGGSRRGQVRTTQKATYGTCDAVQNWEMECTDMMVDATFRQGVYSACAFYREQKNIRVVVHRQGVYSACAFYHSLDR
jgi:hypothetical protein